MCCLLSILWAGSTGSHLRLRRDSTSWLNPWNHFSSKSIYAVHKLRTKKSKADAELEAKMGKRKGREEKDEEQREKIEEDRDCKRNQRKRKEGRGRTKSDKQREKIEDQRAKME